MMMMMMMMIFFLKVYGMGCSSRAYPQSLKLHYSKRFKIEA